MYSENCKILKKEAEEDTNKWKHIPCSRIGKINIIKMSMEVSMEIPKKLKMDLSAF